MSEILYISEDNVKKLLNWDSTFQAVETAMECVAKKRVIQNPRTFTKCMSGPLLLTMPGHLDDSNFGALGCKLITVNPDNARLEMPIPTINANIMLFDQITGALKAIVSGTEITTWRTAAASAVATKHLMSSRKFDVLSILGAGIQGRAHAESFHHFFEFKEIRIWNHNKPKAEQLVAELNNTHETTKFKYFESNRDCVKDADVIVTATFTQEPILQLDWLKEDVHINAVGAGITHYSELAESIYLSSSIYIDHRPGAETELAGLRKLGVEFKGEIGGLITGDLPPPSLNQVTVFQSLGMAVEDCAMARLVYDLYKKQHENS